MTLIDVVSALVPKDPGARRVGRDLPYGPGARQKFDVYAPRRQSDRPLPVIVFFYGGSWSDGSRRYYGFAGHALAALGYVVAIPDYRLVPEIEFPEFLRDCAMAVREVRQVARRFGGDPDKLVLAGHSAGAYNALSLALDPRWLELGEARRAIRGVIGLSGPYDFFPFDGPISQRVFGQARDPEATQPINHVGANAPPMLLITGGRDELVLPRNSVNLGARVEAAGGKATVRVHERLGHAQTLLALSLPLRWTAPVLRECEAFLAEVTRAPILAPVDAGLLGDR
jgi:acetyl esterase/lipase